MLQEGARIAEVEFKVKSNCLTLKQGQRKIRKIMRGKGWVGLVAIEGCLRKKVLYLKSSRNKKDLNNVTATPFLVFFCCWQLKKRHQKRCSCDIIKDIRT